MTQMLFKGITPPRTIANNNKISSFDDDEFNADADADIILVVLCGRCFRRRHTIPMLVL